MARTIRRYEDDGHGGFRELSGTIPREPTPWGIVLTTEEVNSPDFGVSVVESRRAELARSREAYSRKLLKRRLPRLLHWTLDRPRLLRVILRARPRWEPAMLIVPLRCTTTLASAVDASERWLQEQEARGCVMLDGYVFTYTDPAGLPSEVYGP
jgi:hypothetical protein